MRKKNILITSDLGEYEGAVARVGDFAGPYSLIMSRTGMIYSNFIDGFRLPSDVKISTRNVTDGGFT